MKNARARKIAVLAALAAVAVSVTSSCNLASVETRTVNGRTKTKTSGAIFDYLDEREEREIMEQLRASEPVPESQWNRLGDWKKVGDDPPTYIPSAYSSSAPRGDDDGEWFVDARDGKRLFVPDQMNRGRYGTAASSGVLRGEAAKITSPGAPPVEALAEEVR